MSALTTSDASQKPKFGIETLDRPEPYQQVTELIIEHLENGVVPWRCPWNREVGRPRNFHSGHSYQGVNVVLLGCRFAASPWWMTYRQALERGGHVRNGERGAMVVKLGRPESIIPDGVFMLEDADAPDGKNRRLCFIEADRGTMPLLRPRSTASCVEKIAHLVNRVQVCIVTESAGRVSNMLRTFYNLPPAGRGLFRFGMLHP